MIVLERVPASLRGNLTRWMTEVQTGVFVGRVSALVRDLLWEKCIQEGRGGRCCQVHSADTEQGFAIRVAGDDHRSLVDLDGIVLPAVRTTPWERAAAGQDMAFDK